MTLASGQRGFMKLVAVRQFVGNDPEDQSHIWPQAMTDLCSVHTEAESEIKIQYGTGTGHGTGQGTI